MLKIRAAAVAAPSRELTDFSYVVCSMVAVQGLPVLVLTRRDGAMDEFPVHSCYTKPISMSRLAEAVRGAAQR